jgi:hypothetical protein
MKDFLKRHRSPVVIALIIVIVLAAAFAWGGNYSKNSASLDAAAVVSVSPSPGGAAKPSAFEPSAAPSASVMPSSLPSDSPSVSTGPSAPASQAPVPSPSASPEPDTTTLDTTPEKDKVYSVEQGMVLGPATGKDQYQTDPVPEGKPLPVEPQNAIITDKALTCTLSVRCDTILNNMSLLKEDKHELVPENGVILPATTVTFYEGESVFNILQRELKKAKIHLEFVDTPIYNSVYIEGINNLYEFDVGELSGWMYKVNDWFPNYGCSRYQVKDGDVIEWVYTCDLGRDVGGFYSVESKRSEK